MLVVSLIKHEHELVVDLGPVGQVLIKISKVEGGSVEFTLSTEAQVPIFKMEDWEVMKRENEFDDFKKDK